VKLGVEDIAAEGEKKAANQSFFMKYVRIPRYCHDILVHMCLYV
jgi:hypothetical protein